MTILDLLFVLVADAPTYPPRSRHRDSSYYVYTEVAKWPVHVQVNHYATVACKRLERIGVNGKRNPKKPTLDEIDQARVSSRFVGEYS